MLYCPVRILNVIIYVPVDGIAPNMHIGAIVGLTPLLKTKDDLSICIYEIEK